MRGRFSFLLGLCAVPVIFRMVFRLLCEAGCSFLLGCFGCFGRGVPLSFLRKVAGVFTSGVEAFPLIPDRRGSCL